VSDDDPYDLKRLRIDPATLSTPPTPAKIRKRNEQFVILPMWWYERLKNPVATGATCLVAWYLLHLSWKHHGKPFRLPNGMLKYDGISRYSKWRALAELERRGLIANDRRRRKSPVIRVHTTQP
jgi:hypothetical protein